MFTGIVRERGRVEEIRGGDDGVRLSVRAPETSRGTRPGDSVAVNGVCLTATEVVDGLLAFDAVPETLRRTSLGHLAVGDELNLEPALRAGEPLGGHIVQGHVDGTGSVRSLLPEGEAKRLAVDVPSDLARYCVEKGPIAIEGVSLTIAALGEDGSVAVALVPHTLATTTLGALEPGDPVNLEVDVLAKYVDRLLEGRRSS